MAEVNSQIRSGRLRVALPIFGVKQKLSQGIMGKIERKVLEQEGVNAENFFVNVLSRTGGKGGLRTAVTPIKDFKLQSVSVNSDDGTCQVKVSFMLFRGSYATVVLREIIKAFRPYNSWLLGS